MISNALRWLILLLIANFADVSWAFSQTATDFKSGLGYYYKTDGKMSYLGRTTQVAYVNINALNTVGTRWANVSAPGILAELKRLLRFDLVDYIGTVDFSELQKNSHKVKKDVRFFSYGLDFTRLGPDPPADNFAFCYLSADQKLVGPRPVRLYPISTVGSPIYELAVPDLVSDFATGHTEHTMWFINTRYDCISGWLFRFPSSVTPKESIRNTGPAPNFPPSWDSGSRESAHPNNPPPVAPIIAGDAPSGIAHAVRAPGNPNPVAPPYVNPNPPIPAEVDPHNHLPSNTIPR